MPMTPEAFAQKINEWGRGTMVERQGRRFLTAGNDGRATAAALRGANPTGHDRSRIAKLVAALPAPRAA